VISDVWPGLESLFTPGEEIVLADGPEAVLAELTAKGDGRRRSLAEGARRRVLAEHTSVHRARTLAEDLIAAARAPRAKVVNG
jgi:spore maturation protein CgeB